MDEYIKKSEAVDVIVKYPYDIAGKTATAIKMIEDLPSADVVPKSEYDAVVSAVDNSTKEFLKLHDDYQKAKSEVEKLVQDGTRLVQENEALKDNNEHLAVILEETKAEVGKLQNELVIWKQNRFNLFQRLECYEMARQNVAREIFEELDNLKKQYIKGDIDEHKFIVRLFLLKKKYTEIEVEN